MERSNFIKLLEEYKNKAIQEHYKQCRVQAALLISDEFKTAMLELENACKTVSIGLSRVSAELESIAKENMLSNACGHSYFNTPSSRILDTVIDSLDEKIRRLDLCKKKEREIRYKFDAAIKAAKMSRSAARLKELADALGIETPSIEVDNSAKAQIDTEFVKEKIKSVLLLK
jgi:hypothetical protein